MTALQAGMSVIGGAVQAAGAMQAAEAEAQAHEYNAAVAERNARVIQQQSRQAVGDLRNANRRQLQALRSSYATNGVSMTGSALDVMADTVKEQKLSVRRLKYKAKLLILEQEDTRNLELMSASNARAAGQISAASALLGGVSGAINAVAA